MPVDLPVLCKKYDDDQPRMVSLQAMQPALLPHRRTEFVSGEMLVIY